MKKHLIAAAVAAAVAVPAMAQVTMSGRIDTSVGSAKNHVGNTSSRMSSSVLTTNQIVFSGSEDLGGGLKANFNITSGFASNDQNSATNAEANATGSFVLGDRGMQVGVSGGFGAIDIGKTTGTMMNSTTASGLTGNLGNLSTLNARPNNSISYTTRAVSGFTGRVIYSLGSQSATAAPSTNKLTEGSIQYAAGPLLVRGAYSVTNEATTSTSVASTSIFGVASGAVTTGLADGKVTETAAQVDYNFGMARVNFRYQTRAHAVPITGEVSGTSNAYDFNQYGIGVAVPFGATTVAADFSSTDSKRATGAGDIRVMSLTAVNALSKRTNAYAAYAGRTTGLSTDQAASLFAVGVRHSF